MKFFKKGIAILLTLALAVSLAGCGKPEHDPSEEILSVIKEFADAACAGDYEKIVILAGQDTASIDELFEGLPFAAKDYFAVLGKAIKSYEIGEIQTEGREAEAVVTFSVDGRSQAIKETFESFMQALSFVPDTEEYHQRESAEFDAENPETYAVYLADLITKMLESTQAEDQSIPVTCRLQEGDNGGWYLTGMPEGFEVVLTGNTVSEIKEFKEKYATWKEDHFQEHKGEDPENPDNPGTEDPENPDNPDNPNPGKDDPKPQHEHKYTAKVTKQPSCKEEGVTTYTCSCGDSYTKPIAKTPHKFVDKVVKPTKTEKGYTQHTCSVCGYSYKDNYTDPIGGGDTPTPPPVHTHEWEEVYETIHHDEEGHYEHRCVEEAWDEPVYETKAVCKVCGKWFDTADEVGSHIEWEHDGEGSYTAKKVITHYIHHDAVYKDVWVVDKPAWDEKKLTGYKCKTCGATKGPNAAVVPEEKKKKYHK